MTSRMHTIGNLVDKLDAAYRVSHQSYPVIPANTVENPVIPANMVDNPVIPANMVDNPVIPANMAENPVIPAMVDNQDVPNQDVANQYSKQQVLPMALKW
jgi:hypothetical protein